LTVEENGSQEKQLFDVKRIKTKPINVVVVWTQRVMSFHVQPEKSSADDSKLHFHVLAEIILVVKIN
jgi:hypothetical protein